MEIFDYSFMVRAFFAGVVIAALASSLGVFVVVRRYSIYIQTLYWRYFYQVLWRLLLL